MRRLLLGLLLGLGLAASAGAEDLPPDDGLVSWGLGQFLVQGEFPFPSGNAESRASFGLVHLDFRLGGTPLMVQTEVLSFGGVGKPQADGSVRYDLPPSLVPLTLWIDSAFPSFPPLQGGPYLKAEVPSAIEGDRLTFHPRGEAGLKVRLSARIPQVGYEPYVEVFGGVSTDRAVVVGGSVELGALVAFLLWASSQKGGSGQTASP